MHGRLDEYTKTTCNAMMKMTMMEHSTNCIDVKTGMDSPHNSDRRMN